MTTSPCPACGHATEHEDRFCSSCGHRLAASPVDETFVGGSGPGTSGALPAVGSGIAAGVAPGASVLVVRRGAGAGQSYLLTGDIVTAGRAPESDLFLDDITVSRQHAEFRRSGDSWALRDVGSLNGTYVNRTRVDDRDLVAGDEVQIGKYRFVYLVGGEPGNGEGVGPASVHR